MAQHDYSIANGSGAAVRSDLNNALAAIASQNSGTTEPATTYAYQLWADTTTGLLKLRNGANNAWITLRQLDGDFTTVSVDDGSNSAPSIYFNASGTDTGIYSSGTDAVDITTAGTRRFGIASGGDVTIYGGNLTLNTQGDLRFADSDSSNWVAFQSPATVASNVTWTLPAADGTTGQVLSTDGSGTLSWATPSTTVDKISEGNTEAEVVDTGSDGHFKVTTEGTERMRVDDSGRLLVGTSTAPAPGGNIVSFVGGNNANTSTTSNLAIYTNTAQAANVGGTISLGGYWTTASDFFPFGSVAGRKTNSTSGNAEGYLQFNVSDNSFLLVEAMRINSAQELLVGYTTDNGAYKLQVNSQIFATSATIATSDGRYKENVATLGGCLDLVKALRPVSFTWKPQQDITRINEDGNEVLIRECHNFPDGTQVGFIAQEVQEVLADKPWLVSIIKQNVRPAVTDNDGNELAPKEEFLGIAEGNLIAVLTSALQEAIAKIETLEAKVAALEAA